MTRVRSLNAKDFPTGIRGRAKFLAATVKCYFVVLLNSRASGDDDRGAAALPFRSQCVLRNRTFDRYRGANQHNG